MFLSKTFGQLKTSFPYVFYQHFLINRERLIFSTDAIQRVRFSVKNKKIFQEAKTFFVTAVETRVAIKALAYWESSLYLTKWLPPVSALFYGTFTFMHFCRFRHQFGVFGTAFTRFGTVARFCTRYPLTMYFINILTRFGTYLSADIIL